MTCTSEADLKAAKFHFGANLGFSLFEFFTSRKILTNENVLISGNQINLPKMPFQMRMESQKKRSEEYEK